MCCGAVGSEYYLYITIYRNGHKTELRRSVQSKIRQVVSCGILDVSSVSPTTAAMLRRWKCTDTNHNSSGSGQTPHTPIYCHNCKAQKNRSAWSKIRRFRIFGIFGVSLNITVDLGGGWWGRVRMCVWCPPMTPFFAVTIAPLGLYNGTVTNRAKSSRNTRSGVATPAKAFAKRQSEKRSKRVCRGWQSGPAGPAGRPAGASSQPGHSLRTCFRLQHPQNMTWAVAVIPA